MAKEKRKNNLSITFNKDFYNLRAIKKAAQAYQGLADFEIAPAKKSIKVTLSNVNPEAKGVIKEEFSNYVLGMMKE